LERQPLVVQTLYAELMEQMLAQEAGRSIGDVEGCFTTKNIKGEQYVYFQYSDPGGRKRQTYIGKGDLRWTGSWIALLPTGRARKTTSMRSNVFARCSGPGAP
jgi:hypothetical protein